MESQALDLIAGTVKNAVGGAKSGDLWKVKRNLIRTHPKLQPREKTTQRYQDRVRHLADLIKANGYDRAFPLKVYAAREGDEDVLYVVQGHRRLEAVDLAVAEGKEIDTIPCVTTDRGTTMEELMFATVNGNEGDPLQPIEKARMVRELMGCNLELDHIARRMGYTLPYMKNLLAILETPRDVREMVQEGKVAAAVAVKAVKDHGKQAGAVLQAGLAVAKSKGREKVTPKHLRSTAPASEKSTPTAAAESAEDTNTTSAHNGPEKPAKPDPMVERAARWIAEEVMPGQELPYFSLMRATLGKEKASHVEAMVAQLVR